MGGLLNSEGDTMSTNKNRLYELIYLVKRDATDEERAAREKV